MFVEIQKLEAAARMAMGDFDGPGNQPPVKSRHRFPRPAYAVMAVAVVGLAFVLL